MSARYIVAVDTSGTPWIVRVSDDQPIGPFDDVAAAQLALAELQAAAQREVRQ